MDVAYAVYSKFFKLKQGFSILAFEVQFPGEFTVAPSLIKPHKQANKGLQNYWIVTDRWDLSRFALNVFTLCRNYCNYKMTTRNILIGAVHILWLGIMHCHDNTINLNMNLQRPGHTVVMRYRL